MAKAFSINLKGLGELSKVFKQYPEAVGEIVKDELNAFGISTVADAKRLAPADEGHIINFISYKVENLTVSVVVATDYAAYIEFGTKKFSEQYLSSLPSEWKTFAAQYKGKGGGSFEEMVKRITEWVRRKGITGTYSVKTRRRTGNKEAQKSQDKQAAYAIALSILRNGVRPHPFLKPAVDINEKKLVENLIKSLSAK